jgi:hypothetical protein
MSSYLETDINYDDAIKFYDEEQLRLKLFMEKMNLQKQNKNVVRDPIGKMNLQKQTNKTINHKPKINLQEEHTGIVFINNYSSKYWLSDCISDCSTSFERKIKPKDNGSYTRHEINGRVTWTY